MPEPRDFDLCERAAHLHATDPRARDGIRFDCWNWEEADMLRRIMRSRYPDVPLHFTVRFDFPKRGWTREP